MTSEVPQPTKPRRSFPAQVVHVFAYDNKVVINRGFADGVSVGARFLIYALSNDALIDPETGESLGFLEIVRGRGVVTHVQELVATLEPEVTTTTSRRVITKNNPFSIVGREQEVIEEPEMRRGRFDDPRVGDRAKPI